MENWKKKQLSEKLEALQYALLDLKKSLKNSAANKAAIKAAKLIKTSAAIKAANSFKPSVASKAFEDIEPPAASKASKTPESPVIKKAAKTPKLPVIKKVSKTPESSAVKKASKTHKSSVVKKTKTPEPPVVGKKASSVVNEKKYDFTNIKGIGKKIDDHLASAGFNNLEKIAAAIGHLDNLEDKKSELKKVLKESYFNSKVLEILINLVESKSK